MSTQQAPPPTAPPPTPPRNDRSASTSGALAPRLVLIGLPLLVAAVVAITRPEVYTALFNSPQAIAIVAGIVAAVLGLSALLRTYLSNQWAITGILLVPLAIVGYLFIAPYYAEDVVVDEALPGLDTAAAAPAVEDEAAAADQEPAEAADAADDSQADEPAADAAPAEAAEPDVVTEPADAEPVEEAPAPPGPIQLSSGSFVGLDNHFAEGQAALYTLEDGRSIVRLEDVNLQQVPEAVVYLVPGVNQEGLAEGNINLGPLTGNVGSSNYAIPADVDLTAGEWTVLVWCEVFASPVGGATQVAIG